MSESEFRAEDDRVTLFDLHDVIEALGAAEKTIDAAINEIESLRAEVARLREALADAIECVESWATYASEYFRDKHELSSDLDSLRAALKGKAPPHPQRRRAMIDAAETDDDAAREIVARRLIDTGTTDGGTLVREIVAFVSAVRAEATLALATKDAEVARLREALGQARAELNGVRADVSVTLAKITIDEALNGSPAPEEMSGALRELSAGPSKGFHPR